MQHGIRRRTRGALFALLVLSFLAWLCAPSAARAGGPGPRQSSPIALSPDDRILANVNPEQNTVTIFVVVGDVLFKIGERAVGRDPQSLAFHPDGRTLYVANALDGTVSVIDIANPVSRTIPVGVEPCALLLSPNGTRLYVSNNSSNTVQVLNTATDATVANINLSAFGIAPKALAMTNDGDGDDADETLFVAMFYAGLRAGMGSNQEGQDDQREGRVVAIATSTHTPLGAPNPIRLAPMANTGFNANGRLAPGTLFVPNVPSTNPQTFTTPTGAYPNQLAAIAIQPGTSRAYVVSTGASPNGPVRFNHNNQGLVSFFDVFARVEVPLPQTDPTFRRTSPLNLNQGINLATAPTPRLFMSNPVAMTWRPSGADAWVVIQNSNLVTRLTVDGTGNPSIGAPLVASAGAIVRVDLELVPLSLIGGKAPRGLVSNNAGTRLYVWNFVSRSVSIINIATPTAPTIAGTAQSTDLPIPGSPEAVAHLGAELFYTGRGPQERMSSESWGGCITCHPNGRADGVTWMFPAGPRQAVPLDGMFSRKSMANQRLLNWSAIFDENQDFELNTRGVFGGRGLIDDDRLFLAISGAAGPAPTPSALIEQFDNGNGMVTTTNTLFGGAALPTLAAFTPRRNFGIATLDDDRVYIIGGRSGPGAGMLVTGADTVLEFNPRTNVITRRSSVGFTPRHSLGAAAVKTSGGPRIYAVGGFAGSTPPSTAVNTVQEYNPATDTWRTVASLPTAAAQFGITKAGGVNTAEPRELIHVVGGNTASDLAPTLAQTGGNALVQRYQADPTGPGVWSTFNPAGLTPRRNHGAATAFRGVQSRIFSIGGQNAAGTTLDTVEEYVAQAVTLVATPHTSMPAARRNFGIASTTTTNQIYVIGGLDAAGTDVTTVLEYSIANNGAVPGPAGTPSGTWVTRGNLSAARSNLGVSIPPGVTGFLPAKNGGRDARQDAIAVWIARNLRSAKAPVAATDPAAVAGRTLFGTVGLVQPGFSCATCHGGAKWTRSTVDYTAPPSPDLGLGLGNERVIGAEMRVTATQPSVLFNVGTFVPNAVGGRVNEIRFNGADISQAVAPLGANGFNIPSLLSVHETAPYYYSGLAQTLAEVLDGSQDGAPGGTRHHFVTSAAQRAQLIAFLRSLDQTTPIFP